MFELVLVLAFVMVGVGEMSFALVMAGVLGMGLREQGVMGCFLVSAFLKMLGGFVVMLGRGLVMMGGGQNGVRRRFWHAAWRFSVSAPYPASLRLFQRAMTMPSPRDAETKEIDPQI